ncbi:MAG: ornithine carbamoyltransferase [Synergistaceae bacterium]|nr:ornithine carbamoyltransferase [Synergistaceae bacterium]MBQ3449377.1 ornithine carbamoyltransferase [Synergistaceae bacterium]MBQ6112523.1 ornithine carbamoyltransferase [Synergistaceae bacterium]MBQ9627771.1 ornithine carbamoyltransferase [Synergistaceae bacterium]MBR0250372.1 ornithine carbamoyltransferase [Synergistaceae bacterium]
MSVNLRGRSFLTLMDFSPSEIDYLLTLAADLKAKKRAGIRGNTLAGKNIALIFEKSSTRTRCAFTVACNDEGAFPEYLNKNDIQLGAKEDAKDTARVLGRMFDGIEFRGFKQETVETLAKYSGVPVWNGLTDTDHPTQVLADFLTLKENFGRLKGLTLAYLGDGRNNMSNALMIGCAKMGINYVVSSPKELEPDKNLLEKCRAIAAHSSISIINDPKEAVKGADAIYTDVWVSMGEEALKEERYRLLSSWQVNSEIMNATGKENTIFLHCLPAVKGSEVTEEVFESERSKVFDEAENRMHTIKAVMVATLGA